MLSVTALRPGLRLAALLLAAAAPSAHAAPTAAPEHLVQLRDGIGLDAGRQAVRRAGGEVTRDLHLIGALGARLTPAEAASLARSARVARVVPDAPVSPSAAAPGKTGVPSNQVFAGAVGAEKLWARSPSATGKGVTVAVVDTGIAGDVADFRTSRTDRTSRVVASAVVNPDATTATDTYGHGTHVAGLIAGNGLARRAGDPVAGRYSGTAPDAGLVSIKVSDDHGAASVLDVIAGLQFAVDKRDEYGIRVVNLSLASSTEESAAVDPLDAAVEEAWLKGVVVVAAAGNRGTADDAVSHAPANDPYAITVGAVDDDGTPGVRDDALAPWSSRGTTQDGLSKPDVLAPGAHLVSVLAPESDFAEQCPSCVVDDRYVRLGGTSMAAAVVSGVVADLLQLHPAWTPDQVKAALLSTGRPVAGSTAGEVAAERAAAADVEALPNPNEGLEPNVLVDPATGDIDYTKASWSKASWSDAASTLKASWSKASWSCVCEPSASDGAVDPAKASWSKASWSKASWSSSWSK